MGSISMASMDFLPDDLLTKSYPYFPQNKLNHLKKLSLKVLIDTYKDGDFIDRWICNALEHGVPELHLHIISLPQRHFPSIVFPSATLVNLSMRTKLYIPSVTLRAFTIFSFVFSS
ncbi:hypothetical protein ARALYDRAFT_905707 [Arabidopsis lyrata subsp. lyrata]|uniref:Uncharacterized protein n=1 Tax=Arabidopsis lyrata subsp. lyrata TaxID=81972 RepID=D7LMN0_ARALL|nr:hypothetical protein ARALYDRAFT_905707 [Arabidopsis lyrata subsp. lyrata]